MGVSQLATGGAPILDGRRQPSFGGTSRMTRECQVRICERLGVKLPGPTRQRCGNVGTRSRQARLREASASEPSMKCRKRIRRCRNRGVTLPPGSARENPEACPSGIRHVGGAKLNQALVRNVRTCRSDAKGEVASGQNREDESTDAEHRGGAARSVRWAAHESGGLKSLRRSDEGRCIQRRG